MISSDDWKDDAELTEMINEMTVVLDKIEAIREDKVDNSADLTALIVAYDWFINEEWISGLGNATLDELKSKLDDIVNALKSLNVEITSAMRDAIAFVPATVEDFIDGTENVINSMRAELSDIYYEYYSEDREEYSREDYDDFYLAIVNEYGSLEAYWNSRQ